MNYDEKRAGMPTMGQTQEKPEEPTKPEAYLDEGTQDLDEVIRQIAGSGGFIRIKRRPPEGAEFYMIPGKFPTAEFDVDNIAKRFGGGEYKAQAFKPDGKFHKGFQFSIDPRQTGAVDKPEQNGGVLSPSAREEIKSMFGFLRDIGVGKNSESGENTKLLVAMMQEQSKQQAQVMQGIFSVLAGMMQNQPQNQGPKLTEIMEMCRAMQPKQTPLDEQLKLFKQFKQLSESEQTTEEDNSVMNSFFRAIPKALGMLQNPSVEAAPAGSGAQEQGAMSGFQEQFQRYVARCVKAAESGRDPYPYYELLVDNVPEKVLTQIKGELAENDWMNRIFQGQLPENLIPWFVDLRQIILSGGQFDPFNENEETDDNPEQREDPARAGEPSDQSASRHPAQPE